MRSFTVNGTRHRNDRRYAASRANGQRSAGRRSVSGDTLYFRDIAEFPNSRRAERFLPAVCISFREGRPGGRKRRACRRLSAEMFS